MKNTTAFILILVAAGLFYTFIMPEYNKVEALRTESTQYSSVLGNVSDLTQKRDELLLKYNALPQAELTNLEKILPDNVNVVELALDLDAIASKYGIPIKSVKALDQSKDQSATAISTASNSPFDKVVISFSFISSYDNFRKFEADLEHSMRIIEVKSLSFTTDVSGLNEYQMQIETYWLK